MDDLFDLKPSRRRASNAERRAIVIQLLNKRGEQ